MENQAKSNDVVTPIERACIHAAQDMFRLIHFLDWGSFHTVWTHNGHRNANLVGDILIQVNSFSRLKIKLNRAHAQIPHLGANGHSQCWRARC